MQNSMFGQNTLVLNSSLLSLPLTFEGLCFPDLMTRQMYYIHDQNSCNVKGHTA